MRYEALIHKQVVKYFANMSTEMRLKFARSLELICKIGPQLGRPTVDHVKGSRISNLKELRLGGRETIRVLFLFDSNQRILVLYAGNKRGKGSNWYRRAIQQAERNYLEM